MNVKDILDKFESIESRFGELNTELTEFKKEVFGMADGDILTLKTFILHQIKMKKMFDKVEDVVLF